MVARETLKSIDYDFLLVLFLFFLKFELPPKRHPFMKWSELKGISAEDHQLRWCAQHRNHTANLMLRKFCAVVRYQSNDQLHPTCLFALTQRLHSVAAVSVTTSVRISGFVLWIYCSLGARLAGLHWLMDRLASDYAGSAPDPPGAR